MLEVSVLPIKIRESLTVEFEHAAIASKCSGNAGRAEVALYQLKSKDDQVATEASM